MVKKLVQASTLLREKGYVEEKFDQQGFTECVYNWFREHDVKDRLIIRPKRFVEMENPPKGGWKDMTNVEAWMETLPWEEQFLAVRKGQDRPFLFVDNSYLKNAIFTLKEMAGFVVTKSKGGLRGFYEVSLL